MTKTISSLQLFGILSCLKEFRYEFKNRMFFLLIIGIAFILIIGVVMIEILIEKNENDIDLLQMLAETYF